LIRDFTKRLTISGRGLKWQKVARGGARGLVGEEKSWWPATMVG